MNNKDRLFFKFEYKGKLQKAVFTKVSGKGSFAIYHLHIDDYFIGQMMFNHNKRKWEFSSYNGDFEDLTDYFEFILISHYQ